jgi:predicted DNA-binding mobile mystery protein A
MNWNKDLNLQQLDETLGKLNELAKVPVPSNGWINAIRKGLGMSARNLGDRIGLSQPRIALMEKGEIDGSISLKTLERAAQGLGCRVVYALIPEDGTLQHMRAQQALQKAMKLNQYTERHMALEEQATQDSFQAQSIKMVSNDYLRRWPRDFWDNV